VGSLPRFLLKTLCLIVLITLALGEPHAQAGRSAGGRTLAAKTRVKAKAKTSRIASPRTRLRRAPKLRAHHSLRLAVKRSSLRPSTRAAANSRVETRARSKQASQRTSKQSARAKGKSKRASSTRVKNQRNAKTRTASPPSKVAGKLKKIAKAMGKTLARVKALPAVQRIANRYTKISAATTRGLDRLQARAPPWLAKTMNSLRTYSIVSLAAFNLSYVTRDAKFLGTYFAASAGVSYGLLPAAATLGLDPVTSTVLNALTTPLSVLVLVLRDVHLKRRAGETITMAESAKSILRDYKDFATKRRADSSVRALAMGTP
jgi:hypothetical protein